MSETTSSQPTSSTSCCATGGKCHWMDCFSWQIPMAILLATLIFTNGLEFINLFGQHSRLAGGEKQLSDARVQSQLNQAVMISQKLDALARGIVALAPNDPAAKKLQDDFRITVRK